MIIPEDRDLERRAARARSDAAERGVEFPMTAGAFRSWLASLGEFTPEQQARIAEAAGADEE